MFFVSRIFLCVALIGSVFSQTHAFISSVSLFDVIEIRFDTPPNSLQEGEKNPPQSPLIRGEGSYDVIEELIPDPVIEILDVQLPNDELLITLS